MQRETSRERERDRHRNTERERVRGVSCLWQNNLTDNASLIMVQSPDLLQPMKHPGIHSSQRHYRSPSCGIGGPHLRRLCVRLFRPEDRDGHPGNKCLWPQTTQEHGNHSKHTHTHTCAKIQTPVSCSCGLICAILSHPVYSFKSTFSYNLLKIVFLAWHHTHILCDFLL